MGKIRPGQRISPATEIKPRQRLSPETEIKPGQRFSPRTEIQLGQRFGMATEFKKGQPARNKLEIGTQTIRRAAMTGKLRGWVKIAEPNVWKPRAIFVWEQHHGPVPKGMIVHHKDRNTTNDSIENLELKTRGEHVNEHRAELFAARKAALAEAAD
jgi:HNH endonuclease